MELTNVWIKEESLGGTLLRAPPVEGNRRVPVHCVFLLDISGSMEGPRLDSVKRSLHCILTFLTPADRITLISFNDTATILLYDIKTTADQKQRMARTIDGLKAGGATNLSAALFEARVVLNTSSDTKQGVFLLTDGYANAGIKEDSSIHEILGRLLDESNACSVTTIGYGEEHNSALLSDMARLGNGSYNIVHTQEDVASVFGEVLGGLSSLFAQNLVVHMPPELEVSTGYLTKDLTDGSVDVSVGDIYSESELCIPFFKKEDEGSLDSVRVGVRGFSAFEYTRIEKSSHILEIDREHPSALPVLLAHLRMRVAGVLDSMVGYLPFQRASIVETVESIRVELLKLPQASVLVQMMLDDLDSVVRKVDREITDLDRSQYTQHSAYLSLGRGMRSSEVAAQQEEDEEEEEDPADYSQYRLMSPPRPSQQRRVRLAAHHTEMPCSPFSTPRQSTIVSQVRASLLPSSSSSPPPPPRPQPVPQEEAADDDL
jgi:uncharacterized protein YegL